MDNFLHEQDTQPRRFSGILVGALLAAAALVAGGLWLLSFQPNSAELKQQQMAGAVYEGSPEFDNYTKQLVIATDFDRTSESPLGIGTIMMSIHGTIRNKGTRAINLLEVTVSVIDIQNKVIKEKKSLVVPNQAETLSADTTIPVFVPMDGFKEADDRANIRWKVSAIRFAGQQTNQQ